MTDPLRTECDFKFPEGSCLRGIALEIALLGWVKAKQHGLISANPAPYNLLANGETGGGWTAPTQLFPNDLVAWKHAANGFAGATQRGLALMFDPFVDACLLIEARKGGGPFTRPFTPATKVLVLTDYSPLKSVIGEMAVLLGKDWAEVETDNFFKAKNLGPTGNNLFKALLGKNSIDAVRKAGIEDISAGFGKHSLLIWNYFPFLRGGSNCEGMEGLPDDSTNCAWIHYCDELLGKFLKCVNAERVLFAANQGVKEARKKCGLSGIHQIPYFELDHPGSCRSAAKMEKWGAEFRAALEG